MSLVLEVQVCPKHESANEVLTRFLGCQTTPSSLCVRTIRALFILSLPSNCVPLVCVPSAGQDL